MNTPNSACIPHRCAVLIIGGGPAGSSAATFLAQDGIDVVVLEKMQFPRNQVGESLIPHFWKFTDALGVSEKIQQQHFVAKQGGITVWDNKIQQIKFSDYGYTRPGLHVERDIFDDILLRHAVSNGVLVYEQVAVKHIDFNDPLNPKVHYIDKRGADHCAGSIQCQYIIDASGHSAVLATQLQAKQNISSELNFLAMWGYFKNSRFVGADRKSHPTDQLCDKAPVTFVLSHTDGWLWHIILRHKTSIGLIVSSERTKGMSRSDREHYFLKTCRNTPYLKTLLREAEYIENSLQFRPDYSYYSTQICGDNFYSIGDAAAFVDPIFSHGVQNAFYNASVTSLAIKASLKNTARSSRYSQLCESRMQQFYGFSRALSLGDFGSNGVNRNLVKTLMKSMPPLELALMHAASEMTNRSENFRQLAREAGVWESFQEQSAISELQTLEL